MSDDLVLVADVDREQVRWLWHGRIPRGKVTVLDGDPGTGSPPDKGAALVVIDPLMALLSSQIDSHKDQDVRKVLAPLGYMASRTEAAVVVVRHMNKGQGGSALYRGSGSIGIVGAARAGLPVAPDPDDEGRRILAVSKSNLGPKVSSLAHKIIEDERYKVARVVWDGASKHTAGDLVRSRVDETRRPRWPRRCGSSRRSWPMGRWRPGTSSGWRRRPAWPSGPCSGPGMRSA